VRPAVAITLLALSGCASTVTETNYFTLEHAFTDAAAARALKDAERLCAQKRLVAVKTSGACSLTRCTSHYHCMSKDEAATYQK
jgi:hypothetical protein